ncbi:MAG: shikimate kinase [Actinobacteria bacterium]|nr:shikimate kinase [Actinomycetota bacterium]
MASTVILIGFMGTGKSAVGSYLARGLGWNFFDADIQIEKRMGMPVAEVFEKHGEDTFRTAEAAVVTGLLDKAASSREGTVVSLGGGAVTVPEIARRLRHEPLVIMLDEDLETAFKRAGGGTRPLAGDLDSFRRLFEDRQELYRQLAGYVIDTRGKEIREVSDAVAMIIGAGEGD